MIDRNRCSHGQRRSDFVEKHLQIAMSEASPQLDDGDGLTGSVQIRPLVRRREVIAFGEFGRGNSIWV